VRALLDAAFEGEFDDDDWDHALGGWHTVARDPSGHVVGHGSVVARTLTVGDDELRCGYVEAVATSPAHRRTGVGSAIMTALADVITERFELGVLSTGEHPFYERLGWERWRGPTFVRRGGVTERTADEDAGIMVLRVRPGVATDPTVRIVCDDRCGDAW
jgi:aminoglycoside 2'-N-acetyltransferase I